MKKCTHKHKLHRALAQISIPLCDPGRCFSGHSRAYITGLGTRSQNKAHRPLPIPPESWVELKTG